MQMFEKIPWEADPEKSFLLIVFVILVIFLCLCLLRLITAHDAADRMLAVNMLGGVSVPIIALLAFIMDESFFIDVALVYALISFLATVILSQVYIGIYKKRHQVEAMEKEASKRGEKK